MRAFSDHSRATVTNGGDGKRAVDGIEVFRDNIRVNIEARRIYTGLKVACRATNHRSLSAAHRSAYG